MNPYVEKCKERLHDAIAQIPDEEGNVLISADACVMILTWLEELEARCKKTDNVPTL